MGAQAERCQAARDEQADGPGAGAQGADAADAGAPAARTATVDLVGIRFRPATLHVTAGTAVTFVNRDPVPHDVIGASPSDPNTRTFASPVLAPGQSWTHVFAAPGRFPILCDVDDHDLAGMVGTIVVKPS